MVLGEIHRLTRFAEEYENDFVKAMIGQSAKIAERERAAKQRQLDALLARNKELDVLFERLYEDNVSGKISDERFAKMSCRYEQEQGENVLKIKSLRVELEKDSGKQMTADMFLDTVRQYSDAQKLTRRMLTELIDHIDVYHAEQVNGVKTQKIAIFYNCIGEFSVPERRNIPEVDVWMHTRKGVAVSYSTAKSA